MIIIFHGRYEYPGFRDCLSRCDLTVALDQSIGQAVVVMTERKDNHGTSVTNASETLAARVAQQFLPDIPTLTIKFFERYEDHEGSLDVIEYEGQMKVPVGPGLRWQFMAPNWRPANREEHDLVARVLRAGAVIPPPGEVPVKAGATMTPFSAKN